jgi:hypothetical protein
MRVWQACQEISAPWEALKQPASLSPRGDEVATRAVRVWRVLEGGVGPLRAIENVQLIDFTKLVKALRTPNEARRGTPWARGRTTNPASGWPGGRVTRTTFIHPHAKSLSVRSRGHTATATLNKQADVS